MSVTTDYGDLSYITFPNGDRCKIVSEERYRLSEKVRNYILRERYERGTAMWLLYQKAMAKFGLENESYCITAIREWRHWCYGNGVRHQPIEWQFEQQGKRK